MSGVARYYWFTKLAQPKKTPKKDRVIVDPDKAIATSKNYWLTALFEWMVPLDGQPAPHNIITGQWQPSKNEASAGIRQGFGAIIALNAGEKECGLSGNKMANLRTSLYEDLLRQLKASSFVFETESNNCMSANRAPFPVGDFGSMHIYLKGVYKNPDRIRQNRGTGKCVLSPEPT